jgi:photosystem II stability/assembly factor-like uncharacterized protein
MKEEIMRNTRILIALFALLAALSPERLRAGVGNWTRSGPDGALVVALAAHPSNPSTVYAAASRHFYDPYRRLYKSVDSGVSWAPTSLFGFFNLVVPTSEASVAYATTTADLGATFHRTSDGGETWVDRAGPRGRLVSATVDPNDPMVLYAVTISGFFRTTNGADAWEQVANPLFSGSGTAGIAVDPADSRVLYASLTAAQAAGVYRSSDRGATWNRTNLREATLVLLFDAGNPSRLFAITNTGLHVTTNRGESWRRLWAQQTLSQLAIDPADSNRLYLLTGGVVFVSSDGGETVTPVSGEAFGGNVETITASGPGVVLAGSEKGVYRSEDAGRGWATANLGIREVTVRSLAIDPTDPAVVFAASFRGIHESRDGGASWIEPVPQSPDAEVVAIDSSDHSTLYAAGEGGVHKSTDGGRTWQNKLIVDQIADLVIDPSNPRRLLAAYKSIHQSINGAENWGTLITPEDDYSASYYPPRLSAIAFAPSNGATVYAAGSGDTGFVYRSDDGGNSWSDPTDLGYFWISALAVDSCDPRVLQAGGYDLVQRSGVHRSVDGGSTWSPGQLSETVLELAQDPRHSSSFFAGTSSGLFWTNDRGASWTRFEPALDEVVHSLALDPSGRFLYAGTERGVFRLERSFEPCGGGSDRLCLIGAKYQVSVTARDRAGTPIKGRAITEGDSFGYFSFPDVTGDPDFPEVFLKMVNASGAPAPYGGHDWVFHSSLTDLDYTVTVLETETGRIRTYDAADSEPLTCGRADASAFERDCAAAAESFAASMPPAGIGAASGAELSLLNGRFRATLRATDPRTGRTADGTALAKGDRFGYFSLPSFTGDPSFPEVFVKMADATAQPGGYFWVFHTGLTDLDYTLTVTDQVTGAVRTYSGGATDGTRLCGSADTMAFRN